MATTGTKTYQNYIGGEWVDAASDETFESVNPATGEVVGTFPKSSVEDVDRAVEAAKDAYERWRLVPAPKRAEIIFRVGQRFIDRKDELTELMVQEMGKVPGTRGRRRSRVTLRSFTASGTSPWRRSGPERRSTMTSTFGLSL